jgi:3-oxoacyl-[acyl-carrier protein] reductase
VNDFGDHAGAALVVGGSGGIGHAIVRMLAARGSAVALTFRGNHKAGEAAARSAREWGVKASAYQLDVGSAEDAAEVVGAVAAEFSGLHTLVYAAGPHVPMRHLSKITPAEMSDQLAADAAGFFNVVHPALPALRKAEGSIVAVTTVATTRYPVRDGLSAAPKGAVEALVRGLAAEEGRYGVRANCVAPGMLVDGIAARLMASGDLSENDLDVTRRNIPMRRLGNAVDIAEAVCFLASDRAAFISGQKLGVDGGYSA